MNDQEKLMQQLKEALIAIKKLKSDLAAEKYKHHEPIAIVGMAMRFPGHVTDEESLWKLLSDNNDAIVNIPASRFSAEEYFDSNTDVAGKIKVKQGGFLDKIDEFDGSFYDITPTELENVDPQQRFLLELTHEALENAGINVKSLEKSKTAVFCGVTNIDYQKKHFRSGDYELINHYAYTGSAVCAHAGRLSYLLGLQGPSLSIDTACSSSLVAVHLAAQSLRRGESNMAIVGACNLILEPELTMYFSHLNGLSEDGRCRPFADDANGFVRSEGAAVIILQRLSDALSSNSNILGVIRGSAVNQDGRSNGFTAPDVGAQTKLLQDALQDAGLSPNDIDYIEAHGTGTKIGDPIEFEAIANVFGKIKEASSPLRIGSIKSNIGHTESVAGLAGIIKVLLAIKNKNIPATIHFEKPNTLIDWKNTPVEVVAKNYDWSKDNKIAGVSGFGVTGTNAHIIISEQPASKKENEVASPLRTDIFILPVYGKSLAALQDNARVMNTWIQQSSSPLEDICANAVFHRTPFNYRNTFVANNVQNLCDTIEATLLGEDNEVIFEGNTEVQTIFVFPGQGTQWKGMALQLSQDEPVFKAALEDCATSLNKYVSWNLWDEIRKGDFERIDIVQPVLVAVQIALAKLWQHYGVLPDAVIGHSMGEVSAAYIAGRLSLDDAFAVICHRSLLMHTLSGKGEMMATDLTISEAQEIIREHTSEVSIAVVNSSSSTVISGNPDAIQKIREALEQSQRFAKKINVDVASHSPQMDEILPLLKVQLEGLQSLQGNVDFLSTALVGYGGNLDAEYWTKNLRNTVMFGKTVSAVLTGGEAIFIEMSPHPTLLHAIEENIRDSDTKALAIPTLLREKDEQISFFSHFGKLHDSGYIVDWTNIYPKMNSFVSLPNYVWQKQRYWYDKKPKIAHDSNSLPYFYSTGYKKLELSAEKDSINYITFMDEEKKDAPANFTFIKQKEISSISTDSLAIVADGNMSPEAALMIFKKIVLSVSSSRKIKRLYLVTMHGIVFDKEDFIDATASVLYGSARSVSHEYPELNISRIDIDEYKSIQIPPHSYRDIVIRSGRAYAESLQVQAVKEPKNLKISGVALVTGGTSGLGLETALFLGQQGIKKIALLSRSGQKPETDAITRQLQDNGVEVVTYAADIADKHAATALIHNVRRDLGEINILVHAAGLLEDMPFTSLEESAARRVLLPKLAIDEIVTDIGASLHNVLLLSSAAAVLGTIAQSVYAGANFFLDQYARKLRNKGIAATAIDWGSIGEIGLAAADERRGAQLADKGINFFTKNQFHQLLGRVFGVHLPQVMVIDIDFKKWSSSYPQLAQNAFFEQFVPQQQPIQEETDIFNLANIAAAERYLVKVIKEQISTITKISATAIKEDVTFKSLGIDSMMAVQLKNMVQATCKTTIAVADIWSYPTVEKFAKFLMEHLGVVQKYQNDNNQQINQANTASEANIEDMSLEDLMRELEEKSK